jgi:hypothetical protein
VVSLVCVIIYLVLGIADSSDPMRREPCLLCGIYDLYLSMAAAIAA